MHGGGDAVGVQGGGLLRMSDAVHVEIHRDTLRLMVKRGKLGIRLSWTSSLCYHFSCCSSFSSFPPFSSCT